MGGGGGSRARALDSALSLYCAAHSSLLVVSRPCGRELAWHDWRRPMVFSLLRVRGHRSLARVFLILLAIAGLLFLSACQREDGAAVGVLAGRTPSRVEGVVHVERINDGQIPPEGSGWDSNRTAIFSTKKSLVEYDLGEVTLIEAAFLLGDNNDDYELLFSKDGKKFERAWVARRVARAGVRWRKKRNLSQQARYVRLTPRRGDRSLSVAELSLHTEAPQEKLPAFSEVTAHDTSLRLRHALLLFATAALAAVAFSASSAGLVWNLVMFGLLGLGSVRLIQIFIESFPPDELEVSLARGIAAAVALGVVARETYCRRFPPLRSLNVLVLAMCAVIGVAAFFNLGKPQFFDHEAQEPSVVHNYDMRVYFPVAKYFEELKYDGLYLASVLSYAEEHGGLESPRIQRTELRDLRDHKMRKVREVMPEVRQIRQRFSDARWAQFKKDMAYFWETMGSGGYLGSMRDHGGNATPVWLTIAHLMFQSAPASNEVLLLSGLLDPLLLLVFAIAAWRSFGLRTALVSLIVFGANDFYMFGSNWAGATLRNDWMVYLGLGACALKTERYRLGGALLAFSALIRAFPAISLLALGVPLAYSVAEYYRAHGKLPSWSEIFQNQRWFFRTAFGATAFLICAVAISSYVMGADSWPLWVKKISSFTASPHVNHISLLTVTSGSEGNQHAVLQARMPLHVAATALYVVLAIWASFRRPAHSVALLGILMMPVLMYPANYYIHFVFLLPMLVKEPLAVSGRFQREANGKVWMLILGLCSAQYFTVKESAVDLHFYNASVLLMAATLGILIMLLPRDEQGLILIPFMDTNGKRGQANQARSGAESVVLPNAASQQHASTEEGGMPGSHHGSESAESIEAGSNEAGSTGAGSAEAGSEEKGDSTASR